MGDDVVMFDVTDVTGRDNAAAIQAATKVRVWSVRPEEGGAPLFVRKLAELDDWLEHETSVGRRFRLELVEMTEAELNALGEFDGW